jgi:hypothetical protein
VLLQQHSFIKCLGSLQQNYIGYKGVHFSLLMEVMDQAWESLSWWKHIEFIVNKILH